MVLSYINDDQLIHGTQFISYIKIKMQVFCICIINDCLKPISFIPYIVYPISHTLYRIPKKFQNFKIFKNSIKFPKKFEM